MQKIMQKHGKWILAVIGAFLMLTFTLPSVLSHNTERSAIETGRLNGKKVFYGSIMSANAEMDVLARFGLLVSNPYSGSPAVGVLSLDPSGYLTVPIAFLNDLGSSSHDTERGAHWFLLLQEANRYGITASDAEVTDVIASAHLTNEQITDALTKMGLTYRELRTAIAHGLQIRGLALLAMRNSQVSIPELDFLASQTLSKVQVDYTSLTSSDWQKAPEPTPAQIQKQFDLYKDILAPQPGAQPATVDGHTYPFGYKYPDRVKVQYLKFERAPLLKEFQPTRDDYLQAYRYYEQHPEEFRNTPSTAIGVATSQPAVKPFEQVQDQLVKQQVNDRVDKFLKRVTDRVTALVSDPWKNAQETAGGYREAVPASKWASYPQIVDTIKNTHEFQGYAPQFGEITNWSDQQQLAAVPGIGDAYYESQTGRFGFPELAIHVHELSDSKSLPRLFFQVGVEGPILQDAAGNLYIYRVTDAQKSHDPDSLDEVRPQVINDLKKLSTYQQQQQHAKQIADDAAKSGLAKAAKNAGLSVTTSPPLGHLDREVPQLGNVPGFIPAAFSLATSNATTRPAGATPTTTVNDDASLRSFVLALDRYLPVDPKEFANERPYILNILETRKGADFLRGWLSLDSLAQRLHYTPDQPFAKPDTSAPETANLD